MPQKPLQSVAPTRLIDGAFTDWKSVRWPAPYLKSSAVRPVFVFKSITVIFVSIPIEGTF